MVNISIQTRKAFEVLRDWDAKKYDYDQRFCFFYLDDLMEIPEDFIYDEDLLGWLIDWHAEHIVIEDSNEENHHLVTFSTKDGSFHALWFYPKLIGEPPVLFFEDGHPVRIVASSLEEFVCRLGKSEILNEDSYYFTLVSENFNNIDDEEEDAKATIADYKKFRKIVTKVINCSQFNDHHKLMRRHHTVTLPPLSFERVEIELKGDFIVGLISLPIMDPRVLSVLTEVGYELPLFEPKEGEFNTPSNKLGLTFNFDDEKNTSRQKNDGLRTLYLNTITFDYSHKSLPFNLKDTDNYKIVSDKLFDFEEYCDPENEEVKYWHSTNKEFYICISFEDNKLEEIYDVIVASSEIPSDLVTVSS